MKKIILISMLAFGILAEAGPANNTRKPASADPLAPLADSAGSCQLITVDNFKIKSEDHACQSGTWVATKSDGKVLFCCQQGPY